ncbi:MAG: response regulator receiver sensor signal transduction histidine kinase [Rhodospirillales bacterium]|nr:response regulator receiver sensor signal transduction histidine kinase [Rhodospirillales bacterium]
MRALPLLLLLISLAAFSRPGACATVRAAENQTVVIGEALERLDGASDDATIQDILSPSMQARFRPTGTPRPSITPHDGTVWFRVTLDLPAQPDFQIVSNAIRADIVDLYAVDADGIVVRRSEGGLRSHDNGERWFALGLFRLGETRPTVYLRMKTHYISAGALRLEPFAAGTAREQRFEHAILLLLGALLTTALAFASMWRRIGGAVHRNGLAMSLCALPLAQMFLGLDRVLWPSVLLEPALNRFFYQFFLGGFYASILLFALHFLQLEGKRLLARVIHILAPSLAVTLAAAWFLPPLIALPLTTLCITAALITGTVLCVWALVTRSQHRLLTLAFACPTALSLGIQTAAAMQLLPWQPIWQWLAAVPMLAMPFGAAALLADSVRRRLQTLVQERTRALTEAIESRDRVLRLVAHDLRNPVGSIHAASALLLAAPGDSSRDRLLHAVQTGSEAALRLMDDLLDVAAIESGSVKIAKEEVEAAGWLRQRCDLLRLTAERKSLQLQVHAQGPCQAWFDPARTGQALDNLAGNALKFSPRGSVVVIELHAAADEICFSVRDQGLGIDAAELARLFGEFETGVARPTGGERSTGLGLTIARTLVQAQGGRISVESAPGAGSSFVIHLPRNAAERSSVRRRLGAPL